MSSKGLAETLFPRTRLQILKHLAYEPEGLHLRELERRTGVNSRHLARELYALRDVGILLSKQAGSQIVYRLNPDCPISGELRGIIRKTVGLKGVLEEMLVPFAGRIQRAYVYGSLATGTDRADSDVDLMIVGDVRLRELSTTLRKAEEVLQREINPTVYRVEEYEAELQKANSFIARIHQGSRIEIIEESK
ncbi:MAG: nucleotidyltransferase domain-containing protein [Candidatus Bipolaricaulota bacterium]|nr:nucleotidyltransferase domain-containing protein [Candidatus Bipolaricaulota bacterium]